MAFQGTDFAMTMDWNGESKQTGNQNLIWERDKMPMKKILATLLTFVLVFALLMQPVSAAPSDDLKKEQEKIEEEKKKKQEELENLNNEIDELSGEQAQVQEELDALNAEIVEILAGISILEEEIAAKEAEIEVAKKDLEEAKAKEAKQYENTKLHIQNMYENGGRSSYLSLLLEAKGIGDLLTRMEYVEKLYQYDDKLLSDYQQAKQEVIELKEALEIEEDELLTAKQECELEQKELETAAGELEKICADYQAKISDAKKKAKNYAAQIKKQNDEIKKLEKERQKALENENGGGDNGGSTSKYTGSAYSVDPAVITGATGSEKGKEVALYAIKFLGNPYKAGGTSLTNGTDCSGFTSSVYAHFGIELPRTSYGQRSAGVGVEYANAEPGDLICYAGHVALYIGGGLIVHASSAKTGIKISQATYKSIICVRRVL